MFVATRAAVTPVAFTQVGQLVTEGVSGCLKKKNNNNDRGTRSFKPVLPRRPRAGLCLKGREDLSESG